MTPLDRWREAGARLGWLSLCLLPLGLALGRFWPIYIARSDGLVYQFRAVALYPADALVALSCIGWLIWRWGLHRRPPLGEGRGGGLQRPPPWGRAGRGTRLPSGTILVLAAVALLALAAAVSLTSAYDRPITLGVTAQLALLVLFFLAAVELLRHFPARPLLTVLAVAVVGEALLAVWQAAAQTTAVGTLFNGWATELTSQDHRATVVVLPLAGRWLRSYGSFAHPNILGFYLALTLAVLAIGDDPRIRRLRALALTAGFAALLLTFSRTAGLALLLGAATWLLAARGAQVTRLSVRARFAVGAAVVLLALVAFVRLGSMGSLVERNSIETRLSFNSVAWEVITRGTPIGAGNHVLAEQQRSGFGGPAHNVFLIALAELGPLGLVAWLSILGSLLVAAWQRRAEPRARTGPLVAVAVLSPLLLFDHYLWTQPPGRVLLVWTLAMLVSVGGRRMAAAAVDATNRVVVAAESPAGSRVVKHAIKRGVDIVLAAGTLVACAPILGLLALAVWLDSGNPVIFRAQRLGRGGRLFTMYKFRTMAFASEPAPAYLLSRNAAQGMVKIADDPRVTLVGSWLRRFSLDELPQLWNVIRGEMSLVGPRPHDVGEVSSSDELHRQRLSMRPGLTGLWQVKARTNPSLALRVRYDLEYISRWSLLLDLVILLQTLPVVLRGEGGRIMPRISARAEP